MGAGLAVALISGVVALLSILLSAYFARSNSKLQVQLNEQLEQRRDRATSQSRLEQLLVATGTPYCLRPTISKAAFTISWSATSLTYSRKVTRISRPTLLTAHCSS